MARTRGWSSWLVLLIQHPSGTLSQCLLGLEMATPRRLAPPACTQGSFCCLEHTAQKNTDRETLLGMERDFERQASHPSLCSYPQGMQE